MDQAQFQAVIEDSQKQLLDLSFRNRLLNAKPGRLLIDCQCDDAGRLEDLLADGRQVTLCGEEAAGEGLEGRRAKMAVSLDMEKAEKHLLHMYRHTRTRLEETGLQALHVGLGVLEWKDPQSRLGAVRRMPVIMKQTAMTQRKAGGGFAIEGSGGPAEINGTLLEWLRQEHNVDITGWEDGLPTDESGVDVLAVMRALEKKLPPGKGFSIKPNAVVLGHFEFQKLAMHRDLELLKDAEPSGALAAAMGFGSGGADVVSPNELDKRYQPDDLNLPLPSDACQAAAVASASEGASFVLKGPPGTGKSQTIANIIAHEIGKGKKVLFCTGKTAALDAVHKRLKAVGLDQHCLDLHQTGKGSKAQVAVEINAAMEAYETASGGATRADHQRAAERLSSLRERLNRHADAVGRVRSNGRSLVEAVGLAEGAHLPVDFDAAEEHSPDRLDDLKGMLRDAMAAKRAVREHGREWRFVRITNADAALDDLRREAERLDQANAVLPQARAAADASSPWRHPFKTRKLRLAATAAGENFAAALSDFAAVADAEKTNDAVAVKAAKKLKKADRRSAQRWARWRSAQAQCAKAGLGAALKGVKGMSADEAQKRLERGYWRHWADRWLANDPQLDGFDGAAHAAEIKEFRRLQKDWDAGRALDCINDGVRNGVSLPDMNARSRDEVPARQAVRRVRKEAKKRSRHIPVRKLLQEAGDVVESVKPCLMMSPASVAQSLPFDYTFDVVVFDESSQVRPCDALGALARGRQVILAGDDKQMPPTSFFDKQMHDEADDAIEDGATDMESVLDMALANGMRQQWLRMHYRSKSPDLIAFSNHKYYDDKLVMMPDPQQDGDRSIKLEPHEGTYSSGRARTNEVEARKVVDWVVKSLRERPNESVGVITMNQPQQALIQDLLYEERKQDSELERHWQEGDEKPFVKNLETVQGDERDHIALSVTYAPDAQTGRQYARFGPLMREGGERRLNVACTRAKLSMTVVSNLNPEHIPLKEAARGGAADLKHFLEYARDGVMPASAPIHNRSKGDFDSPFEGCVADGLRSKGWEVVPQVGDLGYSVDLGVVHPDAKGRFLAGVECDGATYHSSATARERDKERQEALENKGWKLSRVWSTDWLKNRAETLQSLDAELQETLAKDRRLAHGRQAPEQSATDAAPAKEKEKTTGRERINIHEWERRRAAAKTPENALPPPDVGGDALKKRQKSPENGRGLRF